MKTDKIQTTVTQTNLYIYTIWPLDYVPTQPDLWPICLHNFWHMQWYKVIFSLCPNKTRLLASALYNLTFELCPCTKLLVFAPIQSELWPLYLQNLIFGLFLHHLIFGLFLHTNLISSLCTYTIWHLASAPSQSDLWYIHMYNMTFGLLPLTFGPVQYNHWPKPLYTQTFGIWSCRI